MTKEEIRVASVPADHPYIRHLSDPSGSGVVRRLSDPRPAVGHPAPGQWWPPRMLEPEWIDEHHDEFDVMHLHFGFDAESPGQLQGWVDRLQRYRIPLVVTVHDLVNPHFVDAGAHLAKLGVLVAAAAEVVTLTSAAAVEILCRWTRSATVIAHPHIVPLDRPARERGRHHGFVIGIHAKSLRANIDPLPVLAEILTALPGMPDAILRLDVHPDVLEVTNDDPRASALRDWLQECRGHPQLQVQVHPRLDDDALWDYLESIDLCVLPYRFGTHSGWLEACTDLGTGVLVPNTGHYRDQHGHPSYGPGAAGLVAALRSIHADPELARAVAPNRREQRQEIAAAHTQMYRRVLRDEPTQYGREVRSR